MGIDAVTDNTWKLGVSHPIPNQTFRIPKHEQLLFYASSVYSAINDATTITFTPVGGTSLLGSDVVARYMNGAADRFGRVQSLCMLVNSAGLREEKEIRSSGTNTIVVNGALANTYAAGDAMTMTSNTIPSGWGVFSSGINGLMYRSGQMRRMGLKILGGSLLGILGTGIKPLLSSTTYRFGVSYKLASNLAQAVRVVLSYEGSQVILTLQGASAGGDWQELSNTFSTGTMNGVIASSITIEKPAGFTVPAGNPLYIDSVVLHHARGFDPAYASDGQYAFTSLPSSVNWSTRTIRDADVLSDSFATLFRDRKNILKKRIIIRATYEEIDEAMLNGLMVLRSWQERGCRLILRTPYRELKPWIIGFMDISMTQRITNLGRSSVDMTFVEE